jgi:hypothetical protein
MKRSDKLDQHMDERGTERFRRILLAIVIAGVLAILGLLGTGGFV